MVKAVYCKASCSTISYQWFIPNMRLGTAVRSSVQPVNRAITVLLSVLITVVRPNKGARTTCTAFTRPSQLPLWVGGSDVRELSVTVVLIYSDNYGVALLYLDDLIITTSEQLQNVNKTKKEQVEVGGNMVAPIRPKLITFTSSHKLLNSVHFLGRHLRVRQQTFLVTVVRGTHTIVGGARLLWFVVSFNKEPVGEGSNDRSHHWSYYWYPPPVGDATLRTPAY